MDIGSALGRAAGVTEEQLRDIHCFRDSAAFTPLEKLVLEYAEHMTRTPVEVPGGLFESLRGQFNEAQMVELTATIAWENYRARFDHALGFESQNFSAGAYCALPERIAASAAGH
ncbi:MAG TPA: hypothetical protein VGA40_02515 [Candidatus Acidoferrales bacterium]